MPINARRPFAGLERVDFTGLQLRLIDAEDQIVGRLAAQLSVLLQGKHKPTFAPHRDTGDVCVVVNAERTVFTGNKWEGKLYKWHTGYPGGLKQISARELWRRDPAEVLRRSVYGMLPPNRLRDARMRKLRIFPGPEHPFRGVELVPWRMPPRRLQDKGLGWALPEGFEPMNPLAYAQRMRGSRLAGQQQPLLAAGSSGSSSSTGVAGQQGAEAPAGAPLVLPNAGAAGFADLLTAEELDFVARSSAASSREQRE